MWRSRARLGLRAVVVALAWSPPARGGGATPAVKVTAANPVIDWLPIVVLVIGLILAAGTAGRLAFRGLRQGGQRQGGQRQGEHASAAVSTIEETRP